MKEFRICICGCKNTFWASRKDHLYFSKACRNKISNETFRNKERILYNKFLKAGEQDEILRKMLEGYDEALIEYNEFKLYKIDILKATEISYDNSGMPILINFLEYALIKENDSQFKIIKR